MPALPLDQLQLTEKDSLTGKMKTLPALHPQKKTERSFVLYKPLPETKDPALLEEYMERTTFVAEDLDWLLALPHDKFWCQVIFDETLQKSLDSYLRHASRKFDAVADFPPEVKDLQKRIHRNVFLAFLRMSTHKESKDHFITPSVFGEILYNNFLFDIPKMLDLCVLFGKGNGALLRKMIENIFNQQPSYFSDLDETIPTILQVFGNVLHTCGLQNEGAGSAPQKLEDKIRLTPGEPPLKMKELKDIVLYLCDTCITLWAFLDVFPSACQTFQKHDFCSRLAAFYDLVIPELETAIKKTCHEDSSLMLDLWRRLSHSRKKVVEIFHIIVNQLCLQPILESSCVSIQPYIEELLQIFTSVLQEKRFLRDYDELFPIVDDLSLLQQASSTWDETRAKYILEAVKSAWEGVDRSKKPAQHLPATETGAGASATLLPSNTEELERFQDEDDAECTGAAAAPTANVSGVALDSLISQVKDLLPDLGEGFILACLEEYNFSAEQVINNLLEDKLLASLEQLDRAMIRPVKPDPTPLVTSRNNVFQDDEFDVFSRDSVDLSRVQKGKRSDKVTTQTLLDDKSLVAEQRERYSQYSVIVEEIPVPSGAYDDYEDEYDDTYDANQVGANDADSDDELISRRPFTIPQVLRTKERVEEVVEEDDEEEEEEKEAAKDHFVQDPAVLRERAEARRMAFLARKGHKPDNSATVVGSAKGHGQNRDTVQERRKKEASKSTRANHNRRTMADRKRSKGMIPS